LPFHQASVAGALSADLPRTAKEARIKPKKKVGAKQVWLAASDFEAAGYDVDLRVLSGVGHTFPRRTTTELRKALRFVFGE